MRRTAVDVSTSLQAAAHGHSESPSCGHHLYFEFEDGLYDAGLLVFRETGKKRQAQ